MKTTTKYRFDMSDINEWMRVCLRNGIKVYPIKKRMHGNWYIKAEGHGFVKIFDKPLNTKKEVNEALVKTYRHYYEKIVKPITTEI